MLGHAETSLAGRFRLKSIGEKESLTIVSECCAVEITLVQTWIARGKYE